MEEQQKKSINYFLVAQGFNQSYTNVIFGGLLTLFFLKIGIREILLGIIAILSPIIGVLSIFSIYTLQKKNQKCIYGSAFVMAILGFLLLPIFFLPGKSGYSTLVIYCFAFLIIYLIANQIFSIVFFPTVTNLVPEKERGVFFGRLRFLIMFLTFVLFYLTYKILGKNSDYMEFFWIFLILALLQTIAPWFFKKINYGVPPQSTEIKRFELFEGLKTIFSTKNFRRFFYLLFVNTFLGGLVGPFLIPFLKLHLGVSSSFCILLQSVSILGFAVSTYIWGKINDSRGSRFVLFSALLYIPVFWLTLSQLKFIPKLYIPHLLIGLFFLSGISNAGYLMATSTRRMALAPVSKSFSFYSQLMIFGEQFPIIISSPLAGFIIQKNKYFSIGPYTIYPLLFIFTTFASVYLLFETMRMEPLKERALKEIFTEVIYHNLMRIKTIIAAPPF